MTKRILALLACVAILVALPFSTAFADTPTDAIRNYEITADINEDATVTLNYHLEWEVLESDGIGPVSWVTVGIPSSHYIDYSAKSDNIADMYYTSSNAGSDLEIYFTEEYYEGSIISFDFEVQQDYMYQVDPENQETAYYGFTPGWFDEIAVDKLVVRWNAENVSSWQGECINDNGYLTWTTSLEPGEQFYVGVEYPSDAYAFDTEKYISFGDEYYDDYYYDDSSPYDGFLGFVAFMVFAIIIRAAIADKEYSSTSSFGGGATQKITRTKIKYFDKCPGCGAPREDGKRECEYCGHSMVESEEVIEEENVAEEDKEALKYKTDGEFHYSSSPNTFVRVNVVNIPRPSGGGRGSGSGNRHSSCAHSSCACASCACACACACAGGGRAGCSTKDFYRTDLKLRYFELKKKASNK